MSKTIRVKSLRSPKSHKSSLKRSFHDKIHVWDSSLELRKVCCFKLAVSEDRVYVKNSKEVIDFLRSNPESKRSILRQVKRRINYTHRDTDYNRKHFPKYFRKLEVSSERLANRMAMKRAIIEDAFDNYSCKTVKTWQFFS